MKKHGPVKGKSNQTSTLPQYPSGLQILYFLTLASQHGLLNTRANSLMSKVQDESVTKTQVVEESVEE